MNNLNEKILKSSIHYFCLNGLHRTVCSLASEGIRMYPGDQTYRFYYGCALTFEGRVQEAIRELERCSTDSDLMLGSILALLYSHNKCQVVDREATGQLEQRLEENKQRSNEITLYYAGLFLLLAKDFSQARTYINILLDSYPSFREGKVLNAWIFIFHDKQVDQKILQEYFSFFLKINEPDILIITAKLSEKMRNYSVSIEQLNQAIALYSRFLPAVIEKIKIHAALKEFELLMDTAFRALVLDKHCIEPQRYLIIYYLAWEGNEESGLSRLQDLISSLELREPKNSNIYFESSQLIARLAFHNQNILLHSFSLIERAVFLEPTNIEYICEMAHQCALLARFQESERHYRNATKLDSARLQPLTGLLITKLMEYERSEATDETTLEKLYTEIDQLLEFNKTTGLSQDLLYLCIKSFHKRQLEYSLIENYLDQFVINIREAIKGMSLSITYYASMPVKQLIDIVDICIAYGPSEPLVSGQQIPTVLQYGKELLAILTNAFPNHKDVLYLSALIKYLGNEIQSALNLINRCLQFDSNHINAHILMAKISINDRNFKTAHKSLENALVLDFQIRNNISYILAKASILKSEKKCADALQLLKNALELDQKLNYSQHDKLSISLQMVDIYLMMKNMTEANRTIQALIEKHQDPLIRSRIYLTLAQVYGSCADYEKALQTLRNISIDHSSDHFIRSRQMMAAIYLTKMKDRKQFTDCYREIVDKFATTQAFLMLGDAYMHILEPESAINIYEQALKKNPKDYFLIRKVGQALIKAHFYERAVTYYKAAIKTSGQNLTFCFDLAHLLWRLKRFEQSRELINTALQSAQLNESDLDILIVKIKLIHLLAQVQLYLSTKDSSIQTLKSAHLENQKLMRRLPVEHPDLLEDHRKFSIGLCKQLADLLSNYANDDRQAVQIFKDSLTYDERNTETYLEMAKIEIKNQNFDLAHSYCTTILKYAPNLEEPILMMADITFRQGDFDGALNLYNELLSRNATYFEALIQFIEAARRFGKLNEMVPPKLAEAETRDAKYEAGFAFCKGIYELYSGNVKESISQLYSIRTDSQYGCRSLKTMVEICVTNEGINLGDFFDKINSNSRYSAQGSPIRAAEILLEEWKNRKTTDFDYLLLSNLVILARKQKSDAEYALAELMKLLTEDRYSENVGLIYATAISYMILKQTPKARNQLKRASKLTWKYPDAEYLEKCWLLLADIHIQSNKFDMANELLRRILRYNRSCYKAYEQLGFIMEKEQSYRDAASNYELAWHYSAKRNPAIGYKLAFNYMKAKRFVDAIDIATTLLALYPDYPKLKKEILDKCRASIKV